MSHLPSSFDDPNADLEGLPFLQKIKYHIKQQPLVPLGTLLTTGAVILAAKNVRSGNKRRAQNYFRWRVGLQGLTLVALVAGSFIYGTNKKEQKTKEDQLREKAKLREQLWIQELETRDQETQMRKKRAQIAKLKTQEMTEEASRLEEELKALQAKFRK
ncbi:LAMI_0G10924g1_1 [Lachancea mirantina]|uniref:Respiratory supercomplex factor 1, mitochondrial n=1 Tax=Lachancea mirantina TaxID=1230905 RepID=A0A1G4KAT0_9SACH|nr:LAMI_0G10924g1_1 [Lachancea mirantina]